MKGKKKNQLDGEGHLRKGLNIDAKKVSVDKQDAGNMKMLKVKVANEENVKPGT